MPRRDLTPDRSARLASTAVATLILLAGCAPAARRAAAPSPAEIPALESQLAENPAAIDVMVPLGAAYREAGRLDDSRSLLERAHRLEPAHGGAVVQLGLTYEELKLFKEARELYGGYIEAGGSPALRSHLENRIALVERMQLVEDVRRALAREAELASASPEPSRVAVFPFMYGGTDASLDPLGRALAEMLATDLGQSPRVSVLERSRVQVLLNEMALADSGYVDPATAARSGRILGAGRIVQGRIGGGETSLRLQAAVVGVGGEWDGRVEPITEEDELPRLFDMEKRLAFDIFRSLGVELTPAERELIARRRTASLEALLEFGRGLEAEDRGDFEQAAAFYGRAAEIDPGFDQAAAKAEQASRIAAATSVDPVRLAGVAVRAAAGVASIIDAGGVVQGADLNALDAIQFLVPGFGGRDPVAEILGQEGLGRHAILRIVLKRPGGTQ